MECEDTASGVQEQGRKVVSWRYRVAGGGGQVPADGQLLGGEYAGARSRP